jgi:hypothetical protein
MIQKATRARTAETPFGCHAPGRRSPGPRAGISGSVPRSRRRSNMMIVMASGCPSEMAWARTQRYGKKNSRARQYRNMPVITAPARHAAMAHTVMMTHAGARRCCEVVGS